MLLATECRVCLTAFSAAGEVQLLSGLHFWLPPAVNARVQEILLAEKANNDVFVLQSNYRSCSWWFPSAVSCCALPSSVLAGAS